MTTFKKVTTNVEEKSLSEIVPSSSEKGTYEDIYPNENIRFIKTFDHNKYPDKVLDKQILKKIDKTFMIPMTIIYMLQFLDKVVLNYAKIMGMAVDLNLVDNEFSKLATYFFVGYIIAEFIQGFYLIQKFPVSKVLGGNIILWGLLTACCAATSNFRGILVVRILLGVTESAVTPCLILITTNFYTKSEGAFRIGIWYSGLGIGQLIGGLLSFLFQLIGPAATLEGWRILFIVVGLVNALTGIYALLVLPSTPLSANNLTEKEKYVLLLKLTDEKLGVNNKTFLPRQILESICDIQAWLIFLLSFSISFSSNTVSTFSATVILSYGFTSKQSALLNMPSGVVSILSSWLLTFFIMKGTPRFFAIFVLMLPAVCGGALMSFLPNTNQAGLLVGIYMVNTVTAPLAIVYSWASSNVSGSTKKIAFSAFYISVGFALANIFSPMTYRAQDAPHYFPAKLSMLVTQIASILLAFLTAIIYFYRNQRREKEREHREDGAIDEINEAWADMTDFENRCFKYCY